MANWNQPALTDTYANFLAYLDARLDDLAYGLDSAATTVTNPPTNSIRWSSANSRWEKFNGTSWAALAASYAIAISGNAATATKFAATKNINGVAFDGSANITIAASTTQAITFNNGGSGVASGTTFDGGTARTISYNTVGAPSVTGTNASGTWSISISGNADTATSATTAASCSGNAASVTNGVYTTSNQLIGGDKSFSGLTNFTNGRIQIQSAGLAMMEMHIPGTHARGLYLDTSGIVRLSTTNGGGIASTQLFSVDGSGNFTAAANVTAYSDERLKEGWRDLSSDFVAELALVKMGVYTRKDNGITQVGVSAQSLQRILPWAVNESTDGMLSVAYGNAALASSVALAREVVNLKSTVDALRVELQVLKG
jgi:hypothetical protein